MKIILTKQESVDILNKKKNIEEIIKGAEIRIEEDYLIDQLKPVPMPLYLSPQYIPHYHNGRICYDNPCVWC